MSYKLTTIANEYLGTAVPVPQYSTGTYLKRLKNNSRTIWNSELTHLSVPVLF
jgi:hypothetical protein